MAGKRLLDAALLLSATRNVAKQHTRIRGDQFDAWSKTSTIAKAVKSQTDRVTLTAQAATAIANRLNEEAPSPADFATRVQRTSTTDELHRSDNLYQASTSSTESGTFEHDHGYAPPATDTSTAQSERASIGPDDAPLAADHSRAKVTLKPKTVEGPILSDFQERPTGNVSHNNTSVEQDDVPEGVDIGIFHTPRGRRLLEENKKSSRSDAGMGLEQSKTTLVDRRLQSEGQNQDTSDSQIKSTQEVSSGHSSETNAYETNERKNGKDVQTLAADIAREQQDRNSPTTEKPNDVHTGNDPAAPFQMHESRVPSSRFGRLWQYAGLGTSMAFGAVGESLRRATGSGSEGSLMLSAGNMKRLVAKLSRMRGAALKLGQMISFQDLKMLPTPIHEVLQRVQDNADYMPPSQRDSVMASNLGVEWRSLFSSFEDIPMAAASIGQVHKATLASTGAIVAVKIQYPGVATSIDSDLNNLSILLTASRLLPRGLFLDKTIANARTELAAETDYEREAACQERFRELLADSTNIYTVPKVIKEASGAQVLTAEYMSGTAVTKPSLHLNQEQKDQIGTLILRLCLRELTEFNFMQTDPNWTNFLFNSKQQKLELLDFGAAREYPAEFVDPYVSVLLAAAKGDRACIRELSVELGYLTLQDSKRMVDAHVQSVLTLAEPFSENQSSDAVYDFRHQTITDRVRSFIPTMVRERLSPPPEETYSLHRKLSGAFLLLAKLGSRVRCRDMFVSATEQWKRRKRL